MPNIFSGLSFEDLLAQAGVQVEESQVQTNTPDETPATPKPSATEDYRVDTNILGFQSEEEPAPTTTIESVEPIKETTESVEPVNATPEPSAEQTPVEEVTDKPKRKPRKKTTETKVVDTEDELFDDETIKQLETSVRALVRKVAKKALVEVMQELAESIK